jgi:hypothetical protein
MAQQLANDEQTVKALSSLRAEGGATAEDVTWLMWANP